MAFSLNMNGVRYVQSYSNALWTWDKAQKQRPSGAGERQIPGHNRPSTGISRLSDGTIKFIYHSTAVVIYEPDNTCRIDLSYGSRSTVIFAKKLCPASVVPYKEGEIVQWRGRFYATRG